MSIEKAKQVIEFSKTLTKEINKEKEALVKAANYEKGKYPGEADEIEEELQSDLGAFDRLFSLEINESTNPRLVRLISEIVISHSIDTIPVELLQIERMRIKKGWK